MSASNQIEGGSGSHPGATGQHHRFWLKRHCGYVLETEDVHFHHDSAVMMPDHGMNGDDSDASQRITGLAVLRACYLHARDHPAQKILIAGHTDTSGPESYNETLSQRRAQNVLHAVFGERDPWAKLSDQHHQVEDYQQILKWISLTFGYACDPGAVDNVPGSMTTAAVKGFQQFHNQEFNRSIGVDGIVGPETWGAMFDLYMVALRDILETDDEGLEELRRHLKFVDDGRRSVGCGENHPIEAPRRDEYRSASNRRVEILFFDPKEVPQLPCHPSSDACAAGHCLIYDPSVYRFEHIPCEPALPHGSLTVILDDPFLGLRRQVDVTVVYSDGTREKLRSDDDGVVVLEAPGAETFADIEYEADGVAMSRRVFVRPAAIDSEDGIWQRLANLGYVGETQPEPSPPSPGAFAAAVEDFQSEHGLEPTGNDDDETRQKLAEAHDTDDRDWEDREWAEEPVTSPGEPAPKKVVS